MSVSRFLLVAAALLFGCQPAEPALDAGSDAPSAVDAPTPTPDAPVCNVDPVPADLPPIEGHFAVRAAPPDDAGVPDDAGDLDAGVPGDAGTSGVVPPTPAGGDPIGTWVFDRVTFYSAPGTAGAYDPEASSLTGTAWAALDATTFRISFSFDITLVTTIAGTVRRASQTRVRGSYVVDGVDLDVTAECAEGVTSGTSGSGFSFTTEGDTGTFFTTVNGMLGEILIVLEGTRRP